MQDSKIGYQIRETWQDNKIMLSGEIEAGENRTYRGLVKDYQHETVNHSAWEYVKGQAHTISEFAGQHKMKNFFIFTIIAFIISGCVARQSQNFKKIMDAWVGKTETELVSRIGVPDSFYETTHESISIGVEIKDKITSLDDDKVAFVIPNSPAHQAGIRVDDVITHTEKVGEAQILTIKRKDKETLLEISQKVKVIPRNITTRVRHITYRLEGRASSIYWGYGVTTHQQQNCKINFSVKRGVIKYISWNGDGCPA